MFGRLFLFFSILLINTLSFAQEGNDNEKHIMLLFAKNANSARLREFNAGFTSYISNNKINAQIHNIFLDIPGKKDFMGKRDKLEFLAKSDFFSSQTDLLIATDSETHNLLLSIDSLLPPGLPVMSIFIAGHPIERKPRFSIIAVNYPVEKNFLLGMKLFPKTEEVVFISDNTNYGTNEMIFAKNVLEKYSKKTTITYLSPENSEFNNIFSVTDSLPEHSFIILSSWLLDQGGNYNIEGNFYPFIPRLAKRAVFGIQNLSLGTGILGGYLTSFWEAGYKAASKSVKLLKNPGIRFHDTISDYKIAFDFKVMQKWKLSDDNLPEHSQFINKPYNIFDDYAREINFIIALIVLLSVSLVVFAVYHLRYIRLYKDNLKLSKENIARKELLDNTLSVMSEGVVSFDTDFKILDINTAAKEMSGISGNPVGLDFESVFTTKQPRGSESVLSLLATSLNRKERVKLSDYTKITYKNEESRVISGNISPVIDSDNIVNQLVLVFRDVTESHRQKRFLRIAVESAKSYTWFFNIYNNSFVFGENYRNIYGADTPNEISMDMFLAKVHPGDREKVLQSHYSITTKRSTNFAVEFRISFNNDNNYEWWERRGLTYSDSMSEEEVKHVYGMDINIDDHKEREKELIEAKIKAEESDRLKSAFLSNMSHEIRTPLNGIVGFANLLADPDYSQKEKDEFVKVINTSSKVLMNLVSDILDLSRIESNTMNFELKPTNLNEHIREIADSYKLSVNKDVAFTIMLPEQTAWVYTDPFRNRQVITNLINNSLKFTEQGEICIGYTIKDNYAEIYVSDTGKGIKKELLNNIFYRFYKVDDFIAGTGLGLPICKAIVEKIGGSIWAESEYGKGTIIRYTIGLANQICDTGKRPLILIAEDLESNYQLLAIILTRQYDLIWAKNGAEAVELFNKHNPSLVLMDIKMPIMDGLEATRAIRKISEMVPIIAQTANAFESDHQIAREAGCNDILTKPIKSSLLLHLVQKYLS
ncbi:MAG: ATP-binding protein [Bacteroidales bacterium]|jgi:PAS domain S-box-containing protein